MFLFFFEVRCIIKVGTGESRSPILKYVFCFSLGLGASLRMMTKEEAGGDFWMPRPVWINMRNIAATISSFTLYPHLW